MDDLISRQAVLDLPIKRDICWFDGSVDEWISVEDIKELPSAEPQIIHCKDCTWWLNKSTTLQGKCRLHGLNPMPEWYCASGEE